MAPKFKDGDTVFSFNGKWISWSHTIVGYTAFLGALVVGIWLHYHKIVQNEHYGYPDEWFPSVSATIGDRYPERSVFQIFIAITSGPRFALVLLWYILTARPNSVLPKAVLGVGIFRTLTCGGWTYVTSTDDHDWHDIFMIAYLVATLPWTLGCLALSPPNPRALKYRRMFAGLFFATLVPLVYFFIQHKVHKIPGAYTTYAFFEWALILFDVAFDAVTALDFEGFEITVKDIKGISRGTSKSDAAAVEKEHGVPLGERFFLIEIFDAAADIYNGFVFWSTLTSLGVVVWYFPLWNMGISGYEAFVMVSISPLLLAMPGFRSFAVRNVKLLHLLSLSGLLAYQVQYPSYRLFLVGFSVAMGCLTWAAVFYGERSQPGRLETRVTAWTVGLLASSLMKYACHTNNPAWPIVNEKNGGWNKTVLVLALIAMLRPSRRNYVSGDYMNSSNGRKGSSILSALGFGGLTFAMHSLLSDSSTMILWVWEGFPVRGPIAVPHGSLTLLAMAAGVYLGVTYPRLAGSWTAFGLGSVGAALLTGNSHWLGFYGGLMLAVYVMAVAPVLISSGVKHSPATVFGLGFFVYNFMVLFHVWIVAYAFVPGGPLVRERTDWVMTSMMLLIGAGVFSSSVSQTTSSAKYRKPVVNARKQRTYYFYVLGALQIFSFAVGFMRFPTNDYTPYHKDEKIMTAGIWTVHFSLDNDMWSSERRMRDAIKELELDVVGLLESDLQRIIMGNRDTTQFLAEDLGMYVDYGPGPNKHTWGCALLSKFPILNSTHHLLPSPVGELAPAIHATLDMYGEQVDVVVFHSGQEEDPEDRRLQSEYLSKLMGSSNRPMILLSYLVTKPLEGNYNTYVSEQSGMKDIDSTDWDRWCEYILYKNIRKIGYARVSRGTITDTELQVGKFAVGQPEGKGERISEDQVPVGMRFPAMFRGEGVRGHRYHVFDEPRYYN
ncbi:putative Integral plasma membrane protein [Trichophyton interdigitale]|uniref:Integral plasma membrane protein n=1 Tax=Trichophyton interdigitale TaxID=101480 RepID=A0A9P4YH38_9EURO|nr:putative Integral plasma membrane protein [Trichophyton interdigitale]KAF3894507.1 putative Integral plasma membrane protein [Trichophyton interdigitale]KAG8208494.1 putative Integral plasma membrane protein [Trichophyton interdigitale]